MKQITTTDDIRQLGTILSVWAHPDDESFTAAGIMSAAIKNGQKVVCITATKGEAGVQDENRWPAARLGEIRAQEMKQALNILGIKKHHWLGYGDGHCHEITTKEAVDRLKEFITQYQPDTILTFGPDGITGHTDHQTVSEWVSIAAKGTNITIYHTVEEEKRYVEHMIEADKKLNIYFNIDKPPVWPAERCDIAFRLSPELLSQKRSSLQAMPSQTESLFSSMPPTFIEAALNTECYIRANP